MRRVDALEADRTHSAQDARTHSPPRFSNSPPRLPKHDACGLHQPPGVQCYGPMQAPQGNTSATTARNMSPHTQQRQLHMTVSSAPEQAFTFSFNFEADSKAILAIWPPLHALQMVTAMERPADQHVGAAAPAPFRATSRESVPGAAPAAPRAETVRIPGAKLPPAQLASLQGLPGFEVTVQIPTSTLMNLLKRTDLLDAPSTGNSACTALSPAPPAVADVNAQSSEDAAVALAICKPASFDASEYLLKESGLYKLSEGFSLMHRGHTLTARTVLFDTCSEVNLLSNEFADANGILYGPCPTTIHTSVGSAGGVMGQVVGPIMVSSPKVRQ